MAIANKGATQYPQKETQFSSRTLAVREHMLMVVTVKQDRKENQTRINERGGVRWRWELGREREARIDDFIESPWVRSNFNQRNNSVLI
jgi:response regulator RpfG family c-di-GMP phosphodiesterase